MDPATLLAATRRRSGLSQRQLAQRAGTSAAAICLYESGGRVPQVDTLTRLLAAAGATLVLDAAPDPPLDLVSNGRDLEALLDLADELPQRHERALTVPPLRSVAR